MIRLTERTNFLNKDLKPWKEFAFLIEILAQELYNGYGSCSEGKGNPVTNNSGAYNPQAQTQGNNNILNAKIDPDNYNEDDEYDKTKDDRLRGKDSKNREGKEIDDKFGPRGSKEREDAMKDLHGDKRNRGGGNDENKSWGELDDYKKIDLPPIPPVIFPALKEGAGTAAGSTAGILFIPKWLFDIWMQGMPGYEKQEGY